MSKLRAAAREWTQSALTSWAAEDYKIVRTWQASSDLQVEYSENSSCTYMSVLRFQESVEVNEGQLDDATLPAWLTKNLDRDGEVPMSGLQLLVVHCDFNHARGHPIYSLSKEHFLLVQRYFRFEDLDANLLGGYVARPLEFLCSNMPSSKAEAAVHRITLKLPFHYVLSSRLALCYDPSSNITYGFLACQKYENIGTALCESLKSCPQYCDHPSLSLFLVLEYSIYLCQFRLCDSEDKLNTLEQRMGQVDYPDAPDRNFLELDLISTTRRLNYISRRASADMARIKLIEAGLQQAIEWQEAALLKVEGKAAGSETPYEARKIPQNLMIREEKNIHGICRNLLVKENLIEKRCQLLVQVVYQFMTARDARTNIKLAESSAAIAKASKEDSAVMRSIAIETKKDSSAMKTVALLGMFFLPGTFVATIFAMPVFNWQDGDFPIARAGFSYYLAITVPLTALVLMAWGLAILLPWKRIINTYFKGVNQSNISRDIELRENEGES